MTITTVVSIKKKTIHHAVYKINVLWKVIPCDVLLSANRKKKARTRILYNIAFDGNNRKDALTLLPDVNFLKISFERKCIETTLSAILYSGYGLVK